MRFPQSKKTLVLLLGKKDLYWTDITLPYDIQNLTLRCR